MQPMIRVPKILTMGPDYLQLEAPSKSDPGHRYEVTYYPSGRRHCECIGHEWFMKKGLFNRLCRHGKLSTVLPSTFSHGTYNELRVAMRVLKDHVLKSFVAWAYVKCQFPEHYEPTAVRCRGCPSYPDLCNIHPIKYGSRGTKKPLIWKLQTAILSGEKKQARRLLRQYMNKLKELK